jgi:HK97 family phage major capsid protein
MAKSIADQLMERRATLINQAQEVAQKGVTEGRQMTVEEQTSCDQMLAEAGELLERAKSFHEGEQRAHDLENSFRSVTGREPEERGGQYREGSFGKWARECRVGDSYDIAPEFGVEKRAIQQRGQETRAMSATLGAGPDSVYSQLWQYAVAGSQLLQSGADIINTSDGNSLPLPVATAHATTGSTPAVVAANAALTSSDATLATVNLTVAKYGYVTLVPSELVADTNFDLEGYIAQSAGRDLARTIGAIGAAAVIAGFTTAGVTGPVGTTVSLGNQATAGQGSDLLFQLFHSVLPEYRTNAAWLLSDPTASLIRQLKATTTGISIWQPALTAGDPDMLVGKPTYVVPQLPAMAANAKPIYFGEMSALKIRLAGGIRFERSNEYAFGNDQVAYRAVIRCGAVTVDPNAVKYFANSAT